jgi:uncharacterized membrane protein
VEWLDARADAAEVFADSRSRGAGSTISRWPTMQRSRGCSASHGTCSTTTGDVASATTPHRSLAQLLSRPMPSGHAPSSADALGVRAALGRLSSDDRGLITLSSWEGLPAGAIGAMLGVAPATVRQRIARARDRLRDALAAEGIVSAGGRRGASGELGGRAPVR